MRPASRAVIFLTAFFQSIFCHPNYGNLAGHQIWQLDGAESPVPLQLMVDGLLDVLDHSGPSRQVRVLPHNTKEVHDILEKEGLSYQILVDDLAVHFEDEAESGRSRRDASSQQEQTCNETHCPYPLDDSYMTLEQMEWYLHNVNSAHGSNVSLTSIGKSNEDRDIWLLHIKSDNESAKSVWIEGGLHAREWISPAVAFGLIPNIVSDDTMLKNFDFYVAPMVNPDGYKYTWTNDRYWRKNRRNNAGKECDGVDLNRNWDFKFGVGASENACSEIYMGSAPFSEPETKALSDAMTAQKDNLILLFSLHSYGQDLLYPWGYTSEEDPPNKEELIQAGEIFANGAEEINGKTYSVVNSAGGLYYASGATDDWALGKLGTKYVYTLELRDTGYSGFALSANEIKPSIDEVWNGLKKLLDHIH